MSGGQPAISGQAQLRELRHLAEGAIPARLGLARQRCPRARVQLAGRPPNTCIARTRRRIARWRIGRASCSSKRRAQSASSLSRGTAR
eukprot:scaffold16728_cov31-Tisochrysis_lutea.AAC.3